MPPESEDGWSISEAGQAENTDNTRNRYELLAWIKASDHRQDILTTLQESPENTTHFKKKWDVATADVPRQYFKDLQARGLVKCLTPNRERYRLYGLTDDGEDLAEKL